MIIQEAIDDMLAGPPEASINEVASTQSLEEALRSASVRGAQTTPGGREAGPEEAPWR